MKRKSTRSVGGRPIGSVNEAAWKRYEQRQGKTFDDYNHGRSTFNPYDAPLGVSEGDGTAFAVIETNLDDGTRNPPPQADQVKTKERAARRPREIGLDALAGWTDEQPWWVRLPMYQFVIAPLWALKLLFWMFAMGFVFYFMSGGGAP